MSPSLSLRLLGATLFVAVLLIGPWAASEAVSVPAMPLIFLSPTTAAVGDTAHVSGTGFIPAERISVAVCGDGGLLGAQGCDLGSQAVLTADNTGRFSTTLRVALPPLPCPCVVKVDGESPAHSTWTAINIPGAPVAPLRSAPSALRPVLSVSEVKFTGTGPWPAWFGAHARRTLAFTVHNSGSAPAVSPTVVLLVHSPLFGATSIPAPDLGTIGAGQIRTYSVAIDLGPVAVGNYTVHGQIRLPSGEVGFQASTFAFPWAFIIIMILLLQLILLGFRNMARARHERNNPPQAVPPAGDHTPPEGTMIERDESVARV